MAERKRIWHYPLVNMLRDIIRSKTPGTLPPKREEHPIIGLLHDVQRFVRRKLFGGKGF